MVLTTAASSVGFKSHRNYYILFLPPANEVWGKVMFLHLSVILSTGEGVCNQGPSPSRRGSVCKGVGQPPVPPSDTMEYSQRAGGTHPTGMHSVG